MINWKIRFKNWTWVSGFIAQLLIVIQLGLVATNGLGITDFRLTEEFKGWVLALANAIFIVFSMLGLVTDPTVEGMADSERVLDREEPIENAAKNNVKDPY